MYRTNHFNSCNFPICDLGNAQGAVRVVDACADADLGLLFLQFFQDHVDQGLIILVRDIEVDETVDSLDPLGGPEQDLDRKSVV